MTTIRDHQRAILAESHVRQILEMNPDQKVYGAYGAICMKLPILIHQAGLAPALHHVAQLTKKEKRKILDHLALQLIEGKLLTLNKKNNENIRDVLLENTRLANTPHLISLTREIQRCLEWYRRFAKSILKVQPGDDDKQP